MNFEVDDLLDHADAWKFKLHEKLKNLTPKQRAEFWKQSRQRARALGLTVPEPEDPTKRPPCAAGALRGEMVRRGQRSPNRIEDAVSTL